MRLSLPRPNRGLQVAGVGLLIAALGPAAPPAGAARRPITGTLSKPGYRLIALSSTGRATSVRVKRASFRLRPPAATVTLHLRAPVGTYAGPVVVGRTGTRAIVGVRAGARLGRVTIRAGYAALRRRLAKRWMDAGRTARARRGVPIGVGNVGLVRVKLPRHGMPGDRDVDGIPNAFDIDDDGDLVLDDYDRPARSRTSARAAIATGSNLEIVTMLGWNPFGFVNAEGDLNADGTPRDEALVAADLAAAETSGGLMGVFWGNAGSPNLELDCGALSYCSAGGTGVWRRSEIPPPANQDDRAGRPAFPECCDADHDGMGSLIRDVAAGSGNGMFILHGATSDQLRAGDVLIAREAENGSVQYPASVGFVFASHPVFASYDDGAGDKVTLSYPPTESCRPLGCQTPVRAGANGDVVAQFTVWRPQRPRLPTEPGTGRWMDVGHLAYATAVQVGPGAAKWCPRSAYTATGPNLAPLTLTGGNLPDGVAFADTSADQPTEPRGDPSHAFGFTLNLSECYRAAGASVPGNVLLQLWAWAVPSDYPSTGASDTHSQLSLQLMP